MKPETQEKLKLFAANTQSIGKEFAWHYTLTKRLAALLYARENKAIDPAAIKRCHTLIKSNTGVFSSFRGDMSVCIAALLSLSNNPEQLLHNMLEVYDLLKGVKLRASDYLVVAAYQIAVGTGDYRKAVERTKAFYDGMKAYHWFYTGQDDYIFAAMLALSDLETAAGVEQIELLYTRLKSEFWDKNSVQALAQILVLCGSSDDAVGRVMALRDVLKSQGTRLDKSYTLPSLGVLALLPMDVAIIALDLDEAHTLLRERKGFGGFSVAKQELLLLASGILASEYADSVKSGVVTVTLSTSITNIIIAQQAAMIAAISASSAAAASAASSSSRKREFDMYIASSRLSFYIPHAASLKDKRQVCRSLIEKTRQRFNASVAEVDTQDLHQTLTIGVVVVSGEAAHARNSLDEIVRFIEDNADAELTGVETDI